MYSRWKLDATLHAVAAKWTMPTYQSDNRFLSALLLLQHLAQSLLKLAEVGSTFYCQLMGGTRGQQCASVNHANDNCACAGWPWILCVLKVWINRRRKDVWVRVCCKRSHHSAVSSSLQFQFLEVPNTTRLKTKHPNNLNPRTTVPTTVYLCTRSSLRILILYNSGSNYACQPFPPTSHGTASLPQPTTARPRSTQPTTAQPHSPQPTTARPRSPQPTTAQPRSPNPEC